MGELSADITMTCQIEIEAVAELTVVIKIERSGAPEEPEAPEQP
ncbi:MAG: hypothetical protein V3V07_09965 [candidate division NC10 bacterium]